MTHTQETELTPRQQYWEAVRGIAEDCAQAVRVGDYCDMSDAIHESVDGSYWVIYYHAAAQTVQYTDNQDAVCDVYGDDPFTGCTTVSEVHTRAAYFAMVQDVWDYINRNDLTAEGEE